MIQRPRARAALALLAVAVTLVAGGAYLATAFDKHPAARTHEPAPSRTPNVMPTPTVTPTPAVADRRHNVVVFMLDDMRWDELRYAPNVVRYVQDRGLDFRNSFSPYPLCCPARASFVTGKYAHNHGVLFHTSPYGFGALDDSRGIAWNLSKAGYDTALIGKYLNGYGNQPSKVTGRSSVHYVPDGWTDWMAGLDLKWNPQNPEGGNTYNYFNFTQNINGQTRTNPGVYSSAVIGRESRHLVRKYHRDQKPFFLWVTPVAPHFGKPREPDDPLPYHAADGKKFAFLTPARPDWVKGRFDQQITHAPGTPIHGPAEADISDKPRYMSGLPEETPEEKRRGTKVSRERAEAIFATDVQFGKLVNTLKRTHEYKNTVIMFTSDNGYFAGEHRERGGKIKPHEPVLKVPFLVAGPGVRKGVRYQPITTFDLTATILDIARAQPLRDMDGESKWPEMAGPDKRWTYPILTEGLFPGMSRVDNFSKLSEVGIRTGRYKYVRYTSGETEFYDLRKDPLELDSLQDDPKYAALIQRFHGLWKAYYRCVGPPCRKPLPADLQMTPRQLAAEDQNMMRRLIHYYDR